MKFYKTETIYEECPNCDGTGLSPIGLAIKKSQSFEGEEIPLALMFCKCDCGKVKRTIKTFIGYVSWLTWIRQDVFTDNGKLVVMSYNKNGNAEKFTT